VAPTAVVEDLDVLEDRVRELDTRPPTSRVEQFDLHTRSAHQRFRGSLGVGEQGVKGWRAATDAFFPAIPSRGGAGRPISSRGMDERRVVGRWALRTHPDRGTLRGFESTPSFRGALTRVVRQPADLAPNHHLGPTLPRPPVVARVQKRVQNGVQSRHRLTVTMGPPSRSSTANGPFSAPLVR
jgi:hypothetical protein